MAEAMNDEQIEDVLKRFGAELEHAFATHPEPGAIRERVKRGETLYVDDVDDVWVVKLRDAKRIHVDDGLTICALSKASMRGETAI